MFKILILLLISFNLYASESWEKEVLKLLPEPLSKIAINKTTLKEVEKHFGKADLVEGKKYYWIRDGLKYALQISISDKKAVTELNYTFTGDLPKIDSISTIKTTELKPFINQGKASTRYFAIETKRTQLVVDPVSKTLYSVRVK